MVLSHLASIITAVASIVLTAVLIIINYLYLRNIEKDRKRSLYSNLIEKVLKPLLQSLNVLSDYSNWGFRYPERRLVRRLRFENPEYVYLLESLDKDLVKDLENLENILSDFQREYMLKYIGKIDSVIRSFCIEKFREQIRTHKSTLKSNNELVTLEISFPVEASIKLGFPHTISILHFIHRKCVCGIDDKDIIEELERYSIITTESSIRIHAVKYGPHGPEAINLASLKLSIREISNIILEILHNLFSDKEFIEACNHFKEILTISKALQSRIEQLLQKCIIEIK